MPAIRRTCTGLMTRITFAKTIGAWLGKDHPRAGGCWNSAAAQDGIAPTWPTWACRRSGIDFSRKALVKAAQISGKQGDAGTADPFTGAALCQGHSFAAVYAHLSVHYFDDEVTAFIFSEVHRVLRLNGYFALRVKSVENELYGQGLTARSRICMPAKGMCGASSGRSSCPALVRTASLDELW